MVSDETNSGTAPFNMALSSLERLNKILIDIMKFSAVRNPVMKYQLALSFHNQAVPLIKKTPGREKMKELKTKLRKVKLQKVVYWNRNVQTRTEFIFNPHIDFQIDDILEEIQFLLQEEGYFMPPSEEEDLY